MPKRFDCNVHSFLCQVNRSWQALWLLSGKGRFDCIGIKYEVKDERIWSARAACKPKKELSLEIERLGAVGMCAEITAKP